MPLYEYECKQCRQRMEKIQSFSAAPEKVCPKCGGELERVISAPALQFKGAGWYVNDYAKSGSKAAASASGDKKQEGNAENISASDGKSETKDSNASETKSSGESKPSSESAPASAPASSSTSGNSKPSQ